MYRKNCLKSKPHSTFNSLPATGRIIGVKSYLSLLFNPAAILHRLDHLKPFVLVQKMYQGVIQPKYYICERP